MENNVQSGHEPALSGPKKEYNIKRLHTLVTITAIMSFMSVVALIMLYLALSDIAKGGDNLKLEWFVIGLSYVILAIFILVVIVTIAFLLPMPGFFRKKQKS
ncbi:MAG: hypothetical protein ACUVTX_09045 [Bacteroidales bacterium]